MKIAMGINAYGIESQPITTYYAGESSVNYASKYRSYEEACVGLGVAAGVCALVAIIFVILYVCTKK